MGKKKRKKPRNCAVFFCCAANSDSDDDFQDDSLKTASASKKQTKEISQFENLPGAIGVIFKRHSSRVDITHCTTTSSQATFHDETKNSTAHGKRQGQKKHRPSKDRKLLAEEIPCNVKNLEEGSNPDKMSKPRKNKGVQIIEGRNDIYPYDPVDCAGNDFSDVHRYGHCIQDEHVITEDVIQEQTVSVTEIESSSNLHKARIKSLLDTLILTFNDREEYDNTATERDEEHMVPSKDHSVTVMNTSPHVPSTQNLKDSDFDPIGEVISDIHAASHHEPKLTESSRVKKNRYVYNVLTSDDAITSSCDNSECIKMAEEGSISPKDDESMPVNVSDVNNTVDHSIAPESDEADASSRSSAECSGDSTSYSCDALPDDSLAESSSDECSKANAILNDYKQSCMGSKENQSVPMVPVPPSQPPKSRMTIRRASKPRVQIEDKDEIITDISNRGTNGSSSPPAVGSFELRQELLQSDEMQSRNETSHNKSSDSFHQESRTCKYEGSTKARRTPPSDMSPSDLREEITNSPGSELTYESSACDSAHQDELPILPETSNKTKTSEERFSSLPNPFGNNPVLEKKLPNRLGSSALVLGAIGNQITPEKDPIESQYCPAPRRLDFSKHLLLTTRQDRETAVESSSEESLQEKGLDDLLKPESKDILMNKKFSRLSQSAFPPSPTIRMKTVETKPAWSFYDKDFSSKPAVTCGFRKEVSAKARKAAPRTRDLPPPQPKDNLLAPSLFGRKPGKDLPPVLGRGPSPHPSSKPFPSSPKPFNTSPKHFNSSPLPLQQEFSSYPNAFKPSESATMPDYEAKLFYDLGSFRGHLPNHSPPMLGYMPTYEEDLLPRHFIAIPHSMPNHGHPAGFNRSRLGFMPSYEDAVSSSPYFQNLNLPLQSNQRGLSKRGNQ